MEIEEKIKARIEQLKAARDKLANELQRDANLQLAVYSSAIQELEALLGEEGEIETDDG